MPDSVVLTVPANVNTFDIVLDGAATYITALVDATGVYISTLSGALEVGTHKIQVNSDGSQYSGSFITDGTFDATQLETGDAVSVVQPKLKESWTANEPTLNSVAGAYELVPGSPHKLRLTLQDLADDSTISASDTVEFSVEGDGLTLYDSGTTTVISSKALSAGLVDVDIVPNKGFSRSTLVVSTLDSVTNKLSTERFEFVSDDTTSPRWIPSKAIQPILTYARIVDTATYKAGLRIKGDWDIQAVRVYGDGTPTSGGTIVFDALVNSVSILTGTLDLLQDLSAVVSASLSGVPTLDDGDLVEFTITASSTLSGGPKDITVTLEAKTR